jgi:hypothetical protein
MTRAARYRLLAVLYGSQFIPLASSTPCRPCSASRELRCA